MMKKGMSIVGLILGLIVLILVITFLVRFFSRAGVIFDKQVEKFDTELLIVQSEEDGVMCGPASVVPQEVTDQFKVFVKSLKTAETEKYCLIAVPFKDPEVFKKEKPLVMKALGTAGSVALGGPAGAFLLYKHPWADEQKYFIVIKNTGNARIISLADERAQLACQAMQVEKKACLIERSDAFRNCIDINGELFSKCNKPGTAVDYLFWDGKEEFIHKWRKGDKTKQEKYTTQHFDVARKRLTASTTTDLPDPVWTILLFKSAQDSCFIATDGMEMDLAFLQQKPGAICTNCAYKVCTDFYESSEKCVNNDCNLPCFSSMQGSAFAECKSCDDVKSCTEYTTEEQCGQTCGTPKDCLAFKVKGAFSACMDCANVACSNYDDEADKAGSERACNKDFCNKGCFPTYAADGTYASCQECGKIGSCADYKTAFACVNDACKKKCYPDSPIVETFKDCMPCPSDCTTLSANQCMVVAQACRLSCKLSDDMKSCAAKA